MIDFRRKLDSATQESPKMQSQKIKELSKIYPHSISLKCNPNVVDTTTDCFLFVFKEKISSDMVDRIRVILQDSDENIDFFQKLLDSFFIDVHDTRAAGDEVIVYFDKGNATHFGKVEHDNIISKWGRGLIWKHRVFEVPSSYGDMVKYSNGKVNNEVLKQILCDLALNQKMKDNGKG